MKQRRSVLFAVLWLASCSVFITVDASLLPSWFQPSDSATATKTKSNDSKDASTSTTTVTDDTTTSNTRPPTAAASWELVDPIVNRELEVSVVAHAWPTTVHSVLCEAWAHWNNDWAFTDALVQLWNERQQQFQHQQLTPDQTSTIFDYAAAKELAIQASRFMTVKTTSTTNTSSESSSSFQLRLLQYALAMRAYSPQCELHRGLARQALLKTRHLDSQSSFRSGLQRRDAFLMVVPSGNVLLDEEALQQYLPKAAAAAAASLSDSETSSSSSSSSSSSKDEIWMDFLLPGETTHPSNNNNKSELIILYANFASPAFASFYQTLVKSQVPFVVRHLGNVHFEEEQLSTPQSASSSAASSSSTVLQGYGVRLDIRNVEYKAFDDRGSQQGGVDTSRLNVSTLEHLTPHFLAGVNLSAIIASQHADDAALTWQQVLWQLHESQQIQSQRIPPTWQRRQLPLQAASVITAAATAATSSSSSSSSTTSSSQDPLLTLTDLSQNLPSVVATLVQIRIPPAITKAAQTLEQVIRKHKTAGGTSLYINGLLVAMDRPAWNVFELLSTIKKEQASLQDMQTKLSPWLDMKALRDVQDAWMQGEGFHEKTKAGGSSSNNDQPNQDEAEDDDGMGGGGTSASRVYRIDVGHGWKQAVIYVNDVEKDRQYAQWPRSLRQMLMSMQFGMPPMVRRNLFTLLAVVDPCQSSRITNHGLTLSQQLMQSSFPVRLGVLLINDKDVQDCRNWLQENSGSDQPCPVQPLLEEAARLGESSLPTLEDLKKVSVSTQAIHRLVSSISIQHAQNTQVIQAYVEYLLPSIQSKLSELSTAASSSSGDNPVATKAEPKFSLYDLIEMHAGLLEGMEVSSHDEAHDDAFEVLTNPTEDDSTSPIYGRALRFAAEKGLTAGMSFINGRPLPIATDDSSGDNVGQIFMEEQNHVFRMIVSNDITDNRPKSVYGKLLSGPKVFSRMHPLLAGDGGENANAYVAIPHTMGAASLLATTASVADEAKPAEAHYVVEAYLQVDTPKGLQAASNFVSVMSNYPTILKEARGSIPIGVSYRIVPSAANHPLCSIFANARTLGATTFQALIDAAINQPDHGTIEALLDYVADLDDSVKRQILSLAGEPCFAAVGDWTTPTENFVVANGRFYSLDNAPTLQKDDLDLLLSLDVARAKAVTKLVNAHMDAGNEKYYHAIARVATFLALEQAGQSKRANLAAAAKEAWTASGEEENPLMFSWNTEENVDELVVTVSAFVDPVTESAQRLAPLLSVIRDELQLPLTLILSPKSVLDGEDKIPVTSYYRFVADPSASPDAKPPKAHFSNLPTNHVLTLRMDVSEPWNVQQTLAIQDTDNLLCDVHSGCSDDARLGLHQDVPIYLQRHLTRVEYGLDSLMFFGQCYDVTGSPPNGLQLTLTQKDIPVDAPTNEQEVVINADGSSSVASSPPVEGVSHYSDTLVMKNVGYWQLRANPGVWNLNIAQNSKGAEIFDMVDGSIRSSQIVISKGADGSNSTQKTLVMKDFVSRGELLLVQRRPGYEKASLFYDDASDKALASNEPEVINVFSLATGHLYERFLKIMMLSVTKRTSTKVKFWLFENFLSPTFKASARFMAERIGCEVEFVTYKWPEWLRGQSEKQRIIWGYKILFLDVLFPLDVKKIIYVDADQVVRGDLKELWDMDLQGAPYGYTPFCTSRESTLGFQFWQSGFWKNHLRGKPYHISALYVVDLETFRRTLVGDQLRAIYQQLSADPNSLSNLDQDLPNYAQHQVPIFSLPQEWLWCESWCSDETKSLAKTIDLCNNPLHKEPKVSMAKRVISGPLFNESWVDLDAVVERYEQEYRESSLLLSSTTS